MCYVDTMLDSVIDPSISSDSTSINVRPSVMAASVYFCSETGRAASPTPLSSGACCPRAVHGTYGTGIVSAGSA